MQPTTKAKVLRGTAAVLIVAALALAGLGVILIKGGAYPPEGTGSLGHVGMVIAGAFGSFLALVFGLFAVFCISKAKAASGRS
jgi:hypothetical protein